MVQEGNHRRVVDDPVSSVVPGACEISFAVPETYNASEILYANLEAGRGARTAVLAGDQSLTYQELCDLAGRAGNALTACGLRRGDRVVMLLDDTPVYPAAFFGAVRAGYVPVLINILSPADLVRYFIDDSAAPVVICEAGLLDTLGEALSGGPAVDRVVVANGDAASDLPAQAVSWEEFVADQDPALATADTHRDEMAFWMYSSGSTGRPKGIVHLQHDML